MSLWTDFRDSVLSTVGLGGNDGPDVVANATASTDVAVNPQITSINIVDLEPLRDLFGEINTSIDAGVAELKNQKIDQAEQARLWMAAGLLGLTLLRKKAT